MKREELLAWIGLVLGIPPIIYMVGVEGKWAAGAFIILMIAALIREYAAGRRAENMPVFTVIRVKKRLEIQDKDGHAAELESDFKVRVNHRTHEFVAAYLGGDGTAANFKIDGRLCPPNELRRTGIRTEIVKRFDHDLMPGEEFKITITYDLVGTFPARTEGIGHVIEFQTKAVELEVIFHPGRPCLSGELLKRYSGSVQNGGICTRSSNGLRLAVDISKPALGAEYILQWEW